MAKHHLTRWGAIELGCLTNDMFELLIRLVSDEKTRDGLLTNIVIRLLRFFRLLRLIKVYKRIHGRIYRNLGKKGGICYEVAEVWIAIYLSWHIIACLWFAVGTYSAAQYGESSWIIQYGIDNADPFEQYTWLFTRQTGGQGRGFREQAGERPPNLGGPLLFGWIRLSSTSYID